MQPTAPRTIAFEIGTTLAQLGVRRLFGLVGSGNFVMVAAAHEAGVPFVPARHEAAAVAMADGYARASGEVGVATVHQGPGFTNAITALVEAAKSRTSLVLLAADSDRSDDRSNFALDQAVIARATGARVIAIASTRTFQTDIADAFRRARCDRQAVVVLLPLDVQEAAPPDDAQAVPRWLPRSLPRGAASPDAVRAIAVLLSQSRRPVLLAGRGAALAAAGAELRRLGEAAGALVGTTAMAKALFRGDPFDLGVLGGFSNPSTAAIMPEADLIVAFGAALNNWTTKHGELISTDATIVQVDDDPSGIGVHRPVDLGVVGDARLTATAVLAVLETFERRSPGWRTPEIAARLSTRWADEPYEDKSTSDRIDPRTFTLALRSMLPDELTVATDSGHFVAWPAIYLDVPDPQGFVFAQAFQSVGLGLATAIGAHLGRPDRLTVAAVGDGGLLMTAGELETLGRLRLPMLVVVYNDDAYGAEIHHFGHDATARALATFSEVDFAAVARAAGCEAVTVRRLDDLDGVGKWLADRVGPLVADVKVERSVVVSFLADAFRDHG